MTTVATREGHPPSRQSVNAKRISDLERALGKKTYELEVLSQAGFDADLDARMLSWRKSRIYRCPVHGSTRLSCLLAARAW